MALPVGHRIVADWATYRLFLKETVRVQCKTFHRDADNEGPPFDFQSKLSVIMLIISYISSSMKTFISSAGSFSVVKITLLVIAQYCLSRSLYIS
jgi:hypothetical protein